jgi:hypothetical protein
MMHAQNEMPAKGETDEIAKGDVADECDKADTTYRKGLITCCGEQPMTRKM